MPDERTPDDTVIVPARVAWEEYTSYATYVCQPDRSFRTEVDYLGFYAEGAIQPLIAEIYEYLPSVTFTLAEAERHRAEGRRWVARLIIRFLDEERRGVGETYGVFLLSGPNDTATVKLPGPIVNDSATDGRTTAWTQNQRYTSIDRLRSGVERTSQL